MPSTTIKNDLICRLSDYGINVASETDRTTKKPVQVITHDKAIELTPNLTNWAFNRPLKRLVFYEAHSIISNKDFCSLASKMLSLHAQKIFISATLPPHFITSIESLAREELPVIRQYSTARQNIEYCVLDCKWRSSASIYLRWIVEEFIDKLTTNPNALLLIFVTDIAEAKLIKPFLPFGIRPTTFEDGIEDRRKVLAGLGNGRYNAIICTKPITLEMDQSNVSLIIHWCKIFSLIEFAQATGQAGIAGQPIKSIYLKFHDHKKHSEDPDYHAAIEYGARKHCRRVTMTEYMDGHPLSCRMRQGYAKCDLCQFCPSPFRQRVDAHPGHLFKADFQFEFVRQRVEAEPRFYCLRNDEHSDGEAPCDGARNYFNCHIRELMTLGHCYTCGLKEVTDSGLRRHNSSESKSCKYSHAMQEALMYCHMAHRNEPLTNFHLSCALENRVRNATIKTNTVSYSGDVHIVQSAIQVLFCSMFGDALVLS